MTTRYEQSPADIAILHELAPTAVRLLDTHMANRRIWYPDELIPYDEARNFKPEDDFKLDRGPLLPATTSALFVNLLTEDNLPEYRLTISRTMRGLDVYEDWAKIWTAEENRHAIAIRGIIIAKRLIGHRELEDARMAQMTTGITPQPRNPKALTIYTKLQEQATKIAHRNTGKEVKAENPNHDADVHKLLGYVAGDEGMHEDFYGGLVKAGFVIDPSGFMIEADDQITNFKMPGTGIPGFSEHSKRIARANILNNTIVKEQIFDPAIKDWGIDNLNGLSDEAERARDHLTEQMARLTKVIEWSREKRAHKSR